MKKELKIITLSSLVIFIILALVFFVGFCLILKFLPNYDSSAFNFRIVYGFIIASALVCLLCRDIIFAIKIKNNILTFYAIQNYKIRTINLDLNKVVNCKMNISTIDVASYTDIKLSLEFELSDNTENVVLNYNAISYDHQNIIKKFYALKDYISQFSYSLNLDNAPKRKKEIEKLFHNNMQISLYESILNILGKVLILFSITYIFILIYAILTDIV